MWKGRIVFECSTKWGLRRTWSWQSSASLSKLPAWLARLPSLGLFCDKLIHCFLPALPEAWFLRHFRAFDRRREIYSQPVVSKVGVLRRENHRLAKRPCLEARPASDHGGLPKYSGPGCTRFSRDSHHLSSKIPLALLRRAGPLSFRPGPAGRPHPNSQVVARRAAHLY